MLEKSYLTQLFSIVLISILSVVVGSGQAMAKVDMDPGLWEITSQLEAPDMPMSMPATTVKQCITEEDLVPQSNTAESGCEVFNIKTSGNTISYKMKCSAGGNDSVSSGVLTYNGSTMKGTIKMEVSGRAAMQMTTKLSGKRIGPCKK
jgi:hypothetical protein